MNIKRIYIILYFLAIIMLFVGINVIKDPFGSTLSGFIAAIFAIVGVVVQNIEWLQLKLRDSDNSSPDQDTVAQKDDRDYDRRLK